MEISIDEMRQKIYRGINKLEDTGNIYEILRNMDIPKTTNSNGIFVNLCCLNDTQIRDLYKIVVSIKKPTIPDQILPQIIITKQTTKDTRKQYKKPRFTKLQKEILSITI